MKDRTFIIEGNCATHITSNSASPLINFERLRSLDEASWLDISKFSEPYPFAATFSSIITTLPSILSNNPPLTFPPRPSLKLKANRSITFSSKRSNSSQSPDQTAAIVEGRLALSCDDMVEGGWMKVLQAWSSLCEK